MSQQLTTLQSTIISAKQEFTEIAKTTKVDLSFEKECSFALQILQNPDNKYLKDTADANPLSLKVAITNLANIGLSLNTAQKLAYLVPRGKKVCLDISYLGLMYLAAKEGKIKFATGSVVREGDDFTFNGKSQKVTHRFNPFDDNRLKNRIIGAYCEAVLPDNSVIVEIMSRAEIEKVKECSKMEKKTIWTQWEEQMFIKTVVKRASKFWVYGGSEGTLTANAIEYLNTEMEEGIAPKGANADALANVLHDKPNEMLKKSATLMAINEIIDVETGEINQSPPEAKTPKDYIWQMVEQHKLHDKYAELLDDYSVTSVDNLSELEQKNLWQSLKNIIKQKVNSAEGE